MRRVLTRLVLAAGFATAGFVMATLADAQAADLGIYGAPAPDGVPCDSAEAKAFDSVWLGHFTGGYSHHLGPGLPVVLDWRDEKLCYASRRSCDRALSGMRREFHNPEGYFTCLPIR